MLVKDSSQRPETSRYLHNSKVLVSVSQIRRSKRVKVFKPGPARHLGHTDVQNIVYQ